MNVTPRITFVGLTVAFLGVAALVAVWHRSRRWRITAERVTASAVSAHADADRLAEALRLAEAALGGYKWLWNNRHNADSRMFRELFEAAHEDEERARLAAREALRQHDEAT